MNEKKIPSRVAALQNIQDFPDLTPTIAAADTLRKRLPDHRLPIDNRWFLFFLDTDSVRVAERTIRLALYKECEIISFLEFEKRTVEGKKHDFTKLQANQQLFVLVSGMDLETKDCYRSICDFVQFRKNALIEKASAPMGADGGLFSPGRNCNFAFYDTEYDSLKELAAATYWIDYPVLKQQDLQKIFETYIRRNADFQNNANSVSLCLGSETLEWYDNMLKGLSELQVWNLVGQMRRSFQMGDIRFAETDKTEPVIAKYKNQILRQHGRLEIVQKEQKNVLGMENVTQWLDSHKDCVKSGHEKLTGILMVGIPGTGKSATAHMTAQKFDLPLVKLEMSRILGGRVGDSEKGMREVLQDLKIAAPCILWIDEIEKTMSGADGNDGNGVMQRLFGMLLTFMQENDRPVFTVATANDISKLPPEFFRNGRFDATFCAMMPDYKGCIAIMKGKLSTMLSTLEGKKVEAPDSLAKKMLDICIGTEKSPRFLTGADIEAHVKELYWQLSAGGTIELANNGDLLARKMQEISKKVRAYATLSAPSAMMKIAQSYLTMMQSDMTMAGSAASPYCAKNLDIDAVRFFQYRRLPHNNSQQEDTETHDLPSCLKNTDEINFTNWYDRVLYESLGKYMTEIIIRDEKLTLNRTRDEFWEYKAAQFWRG